MGEGVAGVGAGVVVDVAGGAGVVDDVVGAELVNGGLGVAVVAFLVSSSSFSRWASLSALPSAASGRLSPPELFELYRFLDSRQDRYCFRLQ